MICMHAVATAAEPLRIVHTNGYAPYEFLDSNNQAQGYFIALFQAWSQATGQPIEFVCLPWTEAKQAVLHGQADILTGMTPTKERRQHYAFAKPLARAESRIFIDDKLQGISTLKDLTGVVVGVVDGDRSHDQLKAEAPYAEVRTYTGYKELVQAAVDGHVRTMLGTSAVIFHHLTTQEALGRFRVASAPLNAEALAPAVNKNRPELIELINAGMAKIPAAERDRLARQWVPYTLEDDAGTAWQSFWRGIAVTLAIVGLLVLWLLYWNWRLQRNVAKAVAKVEEHEQRLAEAGARLHHAEHLESLGVLAGGVSHDFNNILQAISSSAELLVHAKGDSAKVTHMAGHILKAAGQGSELVKQLLLFARQDDSSIHPCDLHHIAEQACELLKRNISQECRLIYRPEAVDSMIMADRSRLVNAILNLGINAGDASAALGADACITIVTKNATLTADMHRPSGNPVTPGPAVAICVIDRGSGIADDLADQIFTPFFTTKAVGKGTGLGLATVAKTVDMHGGHIAVKTQTNGPDSGTTMTVYLPLLQAGTDS